MASVCSRFCQPNVTMDKNSPKVALEDCICPICMCILIEPVTMPCQHELCMPCFKQNVEEASLTCPMCRTRISVWARQATRNRTLVNEVRWTQIRNLFPVKVQKRLEGIDDDSSDEVFNVSKPQIAEPGEIRKEYEEQMRKLREEYDKQKQREHEASQRLIQELQAEEEKKRAEQKSSLKILEKHDHDLAQELDHVINEAGTDVPINFLMQESQKRMTRSSSSNSNDARTQESGTLENFLDRIQHKSRSKDPYPFACFTPSQKDAGSSQRASTSISVLFGDKNYVRPETITLSSSSSSLQDIFTPVSCVQPVSESSRNTPTEYVPKTLGSNIHVESTVTDNVQGVCPQTASTSTSHSLLGDILSAESPVPSSSTSTGTNLSNIKNVKSCRVIGSENFITSAAQRSPSADSTDSISPEICHFKPIQCCPRTPPRKVNGKVVEAPIIFTTPRNLNKLELCLSPVNSKHILKFSEKSPVIKKRLMILAEDRKRYVEANSKSTSTDSGKKGPKTENNSHLNTAKIARISPASPAIVIATTKQTNSKGYSVLLSLAKPPNAKAPCTISSQMQLDENCNESPGSCSVKQEFRNSSKLNKVKGIIKRVNSPAQRVLSPANRVFSPAQRVFCPAQIGSGDADIKPLLPLVSCIDDLDELDGSLPLPESYLTGKTSCLNTSQDNWNMLDNTLPLSSPIKPSPLHVSRDLFRVKIEPKKEKASDSLKLSLTYSTQKGKKNTKRRKKPSSNAELKSLQLSLRDMFQNIQKPSQKDKVVSPGFNSSCSTPSVDEGSVHVKSLIDKAISSLDKDVISEKVPLQSSFYSEPGNSDAIMVDSDSELNVTNSPEKAITGAFPVDSRQCDRVKSKETKVSAKTKNKRQTKEKRKKQKKNTKVSPPPNTLDKFMQDLNDKKDMNTDETISLTSSGRKRKKPRRFADDEDDFNLSFVKKVGKLVSGIVDSDDKLRENLTRAPIGKCDTKDDSSMSVNKLSRTQCLSLTKGKVKSNKMSKSPVKTVSSGCSSSLKLSKKNKEIGSDTVTQEELVKSNKMSKSPVKTISSGCSSSLKLSKKKKEKIGSDTVTQEELDLRMALQLQKQFDTEARQNAKVDRSKGSTDEYSLRERKKSQK